MSQVEQRYSQRYRYILVFHCLKFSQESMLLLLFKTKTANYLQLGYGASLLVSVVVRKAIAFNDSISPITTSCTPPTHMPTAEKKEKIVICTCLLLRHLTRRPERSGYKKLSYRRDSARRRSLVVTPFKVI